MAMNPASIQITCFHQAPAQMVSWVALKICRTPSEQMAEARISMGQSKSRSER